METKGIGILRRISDPHRFAAFIAAKLLNLLCHTTPMGNVKLTVDGISCEIPVDTHTESDTAILAIMRNTTNKMNFAR